MWGADGTFASHRSGARVVAEGHCDPVIAAIAQAFEIGHEVIDVGDARARSRPRDVEEEPIGACAPSQLRGRTGHRLNNIGLHIAATLVHTKPLLASYRTEWAIVGLSPCFTRRLVPTAR